MNDRFTENLVVVKNSSELDSPGIYRFSTVGISLRKTLDKLLAEKKITKFLEFHILKTFDTKMTIALHTMTRHHSTKRDNTLTPLAFTVGKVNRQSYIDGSWEFVVEDVVLNPMDNPVKIPSMMILADNHSNKSVEMFKTVRGLAAK